jgi:VanZ family protein
MALRRKIFSLLFYWLPPLVWMSFIFYLSSQHKVSLTHSYAPDFTIFKTLHVIEYAILFFLVFRAFHSIRHSLYFAHMASMIISILYAASDEIHQLYVSSRTGTIRDICIDTVGIIIMYIIVRRNIKLLEPLL